MNYEYIRLVDPSQDAVNALASEGWRMVGPPTVMPNHTHQLGLVHREVVWLERQVFPKGPPRLRVA